MSHLRLLVAALATCASHSPEPLPLQVDGTHLRVRRPDGSQVRDEELVGALLVARIDGGIARTVRIDAIAPDPADGEVLLYEISTQAAGGRWSPVCAGGARAFPLAGIWNERGEHVRSDGEFELTCENGAIAKCVRMGYKPWKGERAWRQHQACTRMVRADYCGDGQSHTRDGTPIDVFDRDGIQRDEAAPGMTFEAAWSEHGAVCVRRTRVPEVLGVEGLELACGERVGKVGDACLEAEALRSADALLFDRS